MDNINIIISPGTAPPVVIVISDAPPGGGGNGSPGANGREVQIQASATDIQWRYAGDTVWINLVSLASLAGPQGLAGTNGTNGTNGAAGATGATGADGAPGTNGSNGTNGAQVQIQKTATHIQWKYDTSGTWTNLVALADITGPQGPAGTNGTNGAAGTNGRNPEYRLNGDNLEWRYVGDLPWLVLGNVRGPTGLQGIQGVTGTNGTNGTNGAAGANALSGAVIVNFTAAASSRAFTITDVRVTETSRISATIGYRADTFDNPGDDTDIVSVTAGRAAIGSFGVVVANGRPEEQLLGTFLINYTIN